MNFSNTDADREVDLNERILGNGDGNWTVPMDTDVGMLATSYLIYKIGNFPLVINIALRNTLTELPSVLTCLLVL